MNQDHRFLRVVEYSNHCVKLILVTVVLAAATLCALPFLSERWDKVDQASLNMPVQKIAEVPPAVWAPPDSLAIPETAEGDLIRYGRELVAHTSLYLGPSGKALQISNGMNCQNCHLKAGKKNIRQQLQRCFVYLSEVQGKIRRN